MGTQTVEFFPHIGAGDQQGRFLGKTVFGKAWNGVQQGRDLSAQLVPDRVGLERCAARRLFGQAGDFVQMLVQHLHELRTLRRTA